MLRLLIVFFLSMFYKLLFCKLQNMRWSSNVTSIIFNTLHLWHALTQCYKKGYSSYQKYHLKKMTSCNLHALLLLIFWSTRNSRLHMFFKMFLKCSNIHRKTTSLECLFNKVTGLQLWTLLKKRPQHRCFPVNIAKFLKTGFFIQHLWWLLLMYYQTPVVLMEPTPLTVRHRKVILLSLWSGKNLILKCHDHKFFERCAIFVRHHFFRLFQAEHLSCVICHIQKKMFRVFRIFEKTPNTKK